MRNSFKIGLFFLTSLLIISCNTKPTKSPVVNESVGYAAELNLTTTSETFKYLKSSLASYLATPQEYLSPAEPFYRINYIGVSAFKASYLEYQTIVLIVSEENKKEMAHIAYGIGEEMWDSLTSPGRVSITQLDNVWAKNQSVFLLYGPSQETIRLYLRDYSKEVRELIYKAELKNFAKRVCKKDHALSKLLKEKHDIEMSFPSFTKLDIQEDGYYSVNWQEGKSNCNLLIGVLDGEPGDDSIASKENMLAQRIEQGKKYLQMDTVGIFYIGTSKLFPQQHQWFDINGNKGAKINGWWVIDGQFRGGPYTRYTVWHERSQKWLSLEALVYYPNVKDNNDGKSKTRYLRTLEAIIHTLK
jgi:hypothetical protein